MDIEVNTIEKRKQISPQKHYKLPDDIRFIHYHNSILVISPRTANWIVLDNEEQVDFFNLLREQNLEEALNKFSGCIQNAQKVVLQLEAKDFENTIVKGNHENQLHIYLTNACNMRCPHCYMSAGVKFSNELSTDEIINLLHNFKQYGGTEVSFSGGEVCTRKDLYSIVKCAFDEKLKINILSNGTLWSNELIEQIAPLVTKIQISIDGYNEEENAKVRGHGNFQKALTTVDRFINCGVYTEIAVTPLYDKTLKDKYLKYAEFGRKLLKKYPRKLFNIRFSGDIMDGRNLKFNNEEKGEYLQNAENIFKACFGDVFDVPFIKFHREHGIQDNCAYGNLSVAANGDLYFCADAPVMKPFANLRTDAFETIMQYVQKAKKISNIQNLRPCNTCELMYICGGDCRIKYFDELKDGNIKGIESKDIKPRKCNRKIKESFYALMIRANDWLFV